MIRIKIKKLQISWGRPGGAGAPQLTRTGDERASPLVTGFWVVKEKWAKIMLPYPSRDE